MEHSNKAAISLALILTLSTGCSPGASGGASSHIGSAQDGEEACAYFESVVPGFFALEGSEISFRRSIPVKRVGHVVCMATWPLPNKAALEEEYTTAIREWTTSITNRDRGPQPKYPKVDNTVSLTITATEFDSPEAAVAGLDSTVAMLSRGVTAEVGGKTHTAQVDFSGPVSDLGDKAVFTEKGSLLLAHNAQLFTIAVSVGEDLSTKREQAIQFTKRLLSGS